MQFLSFHHTGLLVKSIDESVTYYAALFGQENISEKIFISTQNVNVCFVKIGVDNYLELVEPLGEESVVYALLKKKVGYYHMGYKIKDIEKGVKALEALYFKPMEYFRSEAFENRRCIFLFSPDAHLIELIEE
jgi:catechol 2,3-dioxygenase-like lactoylglutathione lyase family enzyme